MDLKDVQITVEPYVGKLTGLATSNDIAEFMVEQGVRALPGNAMSCAIAVYISNETGLKVRVDRNAIAVLHPDGDQRMGYSNKGVWCEENYVNVGCHTEAMKSFLWKFDHYYYADLVANYSYATTYASTKVE